MFAFTVILITFEWMSLYSMMFRLVFLLLSELFFFSLVLVTVSMNLISVRDKVSHTLFGFFSYTEHKLFGVSNMDEEDVEF